MKDILESFFRYVMPIVGLRIVCLADKRVMLKGVTVEQLQLLEEKLCRLVSCYDNTWLLNPAHMPEVTEVLPAELFYKDGGRIVLVCEGLGKPVQGYSATDYWDGKKEQADGLCNTPESYEQLINFMDEMLEELQRLFYSCMEMSKTGTEPVLKQSPKKFEEFELELFGNVPTKEQHEELCHAIKDATLFRIQVKSAQGGENVYPKQEDIRKKYIRSGCVYCKGQDVTKESIRLTVPGMTGKVPQGEFEEFLRQWGFVEWSEAELAEANGLSEELAFAYILQKFLKLPYVVLGKRLGKYSGVAIPVMDTSVRRELNIIYNDVINKLFNDIEFGGDGNALLLNGIVPLEDENQFWRKYREVYVFGDAEDFIITNGRWYRRDTRPAPDELFESVEKELERQKLARQQCWEVNAAFGKYTDCKVELREVLYLKEILQAYLQCRELFKKMSEICGVVAVRLFWNETDFATDIYMNDLEWEARRLLRNMPVILHCRVRTLEKLEKNPLAFTELYANGGLYRFLNRREV